MFTNYRRQPKPRPAAQECHGDCFHPDNRILKYQKTRKKSAKETGRTGPMPALPFQRSSQPQILGIQPKPKPGATVTTSVTNDANPAGGHTRNALDDNASSLEPTRGCNRRPTNNPAPRHRPVPDRPELPPSQAAQRQPAQPEPSPRRALAAAGRTKSRREPRHGQTRSPRRSGRPREAIWFS